jgi:hypothetical protein
MPNTLSQPASTQCAAARCPPKTDKAVWSIPAVEWPWPVLLIAVRNTYLVHPDKGIARRGEEVEENESAEQSRTQRRSCGGACGRIVLGGVQTVAGA